MADTTIEWSEKVWNPTRGCTKVSPGCKHCYAETFAERWRGIEGHPYEQGFDLKLVPEKLSEPLAWKRPRKVFVNSMSDLFQDGVEEDFVRRVFDTMNRADWHTYQVLTKRAERMRDITRALPRELVHRAHIWLGVSVEDRKYGLPRIDVLRDVPAAVRFLSIEPLLQDLGALDLTNIHWVIVGGESGNGARPLNVAWVRRVVEQCREQRVPVFVKQLGRRPTMESGLVPLRLNHRKGADPSEWPEDLRVQQFPEVRHA